MKNTPVDPLAAKDIREQVNKVLRGLGYPEPPLQLDDVRALRRLDKHYYSSSDTSALQESISKLKIGAKQVLRRPTLLLDVVRKAGLRALWLPDRQRILIDSEIPDPKKRHAEAHEIAHAITPHHRLFLLGDDGETLRRSCHEKLEAEANYGSGQLLFLADRFSREALDYPHSFQSVRKLSEIYGNTLTMTLWRLVEEGHRGEPIFGMVSQHPHQQHQNPEPAPLCRYLIASPAFRKRFDNVSELEAFKAMQGYATNASGGSLGQGTVCLTDLNGQAHEFVMETFYNRYEALTLGKYDRPIHGRVIVQGTQ